MDLNALRTQINEIDSQIITLLADRQRIVRQISKLKRAENKAVYDPKREEEMRTARAEMAAELGIDASKIDKIFDLIIDWSRSIQQDL